MNLTTMLTTNKLYRVTLNDRLFVGPDYQTVRQFVLDRTDCWIDIDSMPDAAIWETKRGLWPKRFKAWRHREYGDDNDYSKLLSDLGGIMGKMTINQSFYIDFVNEAKWRPGSFGEKENSCWWLTMYGASRLGLFEQGGLAMRYFRSPRQRSINRGQKGVGRAWILPTRDDLFLFNSYGYELGVSARILSTILGDAWKYEKIDMELEESYVNGDKAIRFSQQSFDPRETIFLPSINSEYVGYCYRCGDKVLKDRQQTYREDREGFERIYHRGNCAEHDLKACDHCSGMFLRSDLKYLSNLDKNVCVPCLQNYFVKCQDCGDYHTASKLTRVYWKSKSLYVCRTCIDKYPRCECGNYYKNRTTLKAHQSGCRTYQRNHRKPASKEGAITLAQLHHARISSCISAGEFWNLYQEYIKQEDSSEFEVETRLNNYERNPTPRERRVTIHEVTRALRSPYVSYPDYVRIFQLYMEQNEIDEEEAYNRVHQEIQALSQPHTPPEPPIYEGWGVSNPVERVAIEGQGEATPRVPEATELAGQDSTPNPAATLLDGSQHVESPSPREAWGAEWGATVDRLYRSISNRHEWVAEYINEWAGEPTPASTGATFEPFTVRLNEDEWDALMLGRFDPRLPEQTDAQVRTGVPANEDTPIE
jgi:hypothetical protein